MKNYLFFLAFTFAAVSIVACNNENKPHSANSGNDTVASVEAPAPASSVKTGVDPAVAASVKSLVNDYLQLKNALTRDNSNDAAMAGKALFAGFNKFGESKLTAEQKRSFDDIAGDAKEMAEHIGKSVGNIPHQREHFDMLTKDMYDMVKLLGAGQPLYVDHCPMYNNNKGADWLSETKEIKNPYLGKKMPACGAVKEELK